MYNTIMKNNNVFSVQNIKCLTGVDMSEHNLPVMVLDSGKEGPVLWLVAALHGDEVNGIEVIHRIFKFLKREPLKRGKIYALPIANPWGFELGRRENPYDLANMNRFFPGDPTGTTTERIDHAIFQFIMETKPTLLIDLHADTINSIPYVIVDRIRDKNLQENMEKVWHYAERFGVTVTEEIEEFNKYDLDKNLTFALNQQRVPAFLIELGGPNVISEIFARTGTNGVKNVLKDLDMVDIPKYIDSETKIKSESRLLLLENITCNESGIIKFLVKPSQKIKKNKPLAKIKDALGKTREIVTAPEEAYVISFSDTVVSFPGSYVFSLAMESVPKERKRSRRNRHIRTETKPAEPKPEPPKEKPALPAIPPKTDK